MTKKLHLPDGQQSHLKGHEQRDLVFALSLLAAAAAVSIFAPEESEQWLKLLFWEQESTVQLDAPLIATRSAVE